MLSTHRSYNQNNLILKINQYLERIQRPFKSIDGYCHGLCLLWLYKMMEENEQWFYDAIKRIISHTEEDFDLIEMDFEKLLAHIEWLQHSEEYINIHQQDIDILLDLPNTLKFSFVFTQQELEESLAYIVPKSKMICLTGPDHSIALFNRKGKYYLFDANEDSGEPKVYEQITSLTTEIIACLFIRLNHDSDKLPLCINIIQEKRKLRTVGQISREQKIELLTQFAFTSKKVNRASKAGITSLHMASRNNDLDTIEFLLSNGARLNQQDQDGYTALCLAADLGYSAAAQLLLAQGADPNLQDNKGAFPMYYAARNGHEKIVKLLLSFNAKIDLRLNSGATVLHAAILGQHHQIVGLLLKAGANCLSEHKTKITPFKLALNKKDWKLVTMMLAHLNSLSLLSSAKVRYLKAHRVQVMEVADNLGLRGYQDLKKKNALNELLNNFRITRSIFYQSIRSTIIKRRKEDASIQLKHRRFA